MQSNPDRALKLPLAAPEVRGWTRDHAPKLIPCAERADCLFSNSLER